MKKANKATAPSKTKAPAKKNKGQVDAVLDMLNNMDDDLIAMLRDTMQNELPFGSEMFGPADPVDLFAEYLEGCEEEGDEEEKNELLADLVEVLSEVKVDANGSDPDAREKIQAIYDLLDDAIERSSLHPVDMMLIGKVLTDAGWSVPDRLKQALGQALQTVAPDAHGGAPIGLAAPLLELAD